MEMVLVMVVVIANVRFGVVHRGFNVLLNASVAIECFDDGIVCVSIIGHSCSS